MATIKGLPIKSPWIEHILTGKKTWEIRSSKTSNINTNIALIKSGTKTIVGIAKISRVIGPLNLDTLIEKQSLHLTPLEDLKTKGLPYKNTYAWELTDIIKLQTPVPYNHPSGAIVWVNIKNIDENNLFTVTKKYTIPSTKLKIKFLESLKNDLSLITDDVKFEKKSDGGLEFSYSPRYFEYQSKTNIEEIYKNLRDRLIITDKEFVLKMEQKGVLNYFSNGDEIDVTKIKPQIKICVSEKEMDLHKYCRYLQNVPNSSGQFRRVLALVYDVGQEKRNLMGIIGLSSTGYSMKDRDKYFGWTIDKIDSYSKLKEVKRRGLNDTMQLSVGLAVPPYNYAFGGKLIYLLAFSDDIQNHYMTKFKKDNSVIMALITTSAMDVHAAVFNDIKLRLIFGSEHDRIQLFDRVGFTSEYSTLLLSKKTKSIARDILNSHSNYSKSQKNKSYANLDINKVLSIVGLNKEILEMNKKGLYVGCLSKENIQKLGGEISKPILGISTDKITEYWKHNFIEKRFIDDKIRIDKFNKFKKESLSISGQLNLF